MHPGPSAASTAELIQTLLDSPAPAPHLSEIGKVAQLGDGVAVVTGLARALADEVLVFASGERGIVFDLEPGHLGVVLLGPSENVRLGEEVHRTGQVVSVPTGPAMLGRVVDALGRPRDGGQPPHPAPLRPVEAEAPGILARAAISRPLATGLKAIDAAVTGSARADHRRSPDRQNFDRGRFHSEPERHRSTLYLLCCRPARRRRGRSHRRAARGRHDAELCCGCRWRRGGTGAGPYCALRGHVDCRKPGRQGPRRADQPFQATFSMCMPDCWSAQANSPMPSAAARSLPCPWSRPKLKTCRRTSRRI